MNFCYKCGINNKDKKLFYSFGKYICKDCKDIRKKQNNVVGNSGMIYNANICPDDFQYSNLFQKNNYDGIILEQVKKSNKLFTKWFFEHYPGSKGIVGRQFNFLIHYKNEPCGIIGFASPPLNYIKFNDYFNFNSKEHSENSKYFLNNNVFRIVNTEKNLATKILKIAREKLLKLYYAKYNLILKGIVTFVEYPRTGSLYLADNWDIIGETEGIEVKRRGENWEQKQYSKGEKKIILGYKYKKKQTNKLIIDVTEE